MSTKTGSAPSRAMRAGGGEERERGADDFVAGADAQGHQGAEQGVGAAGDADRVFGAAVFGEVLLEPLDARAEDEVLASQTSSSARRISPRIGRYCAWRSRSFTFMGDCLKRKVRGSKKGERWWRGERSVWRMPEWQVGSFSPARCGMV